MNKQELALAVAEILNQNYPSPKTELNFANEYQLAVAVMLSAQTTDKKVNQITPNLFAKYPDWKALAEADLKDVQTLIHGVNFHLGKSERLIAAGKLVTAEFGGVLPRNINDLQKIPGIARKSANVITQELWGITEGIVVDTHISRVSQRLGLTTNTAPKKIEIDLMQIVPKNYWRNWSSAMVLHGRYVCIARAPKCEQCVLKHICPSAFKN